MTAAEAEKHLQLHFRGVANLARADVVVKIIAVPTDLEKNLEKKLACATVSIVKQFDYLRWRSEKAKSIRALRSVAGYGFAEAKWIVENFPAFRVFVAVNNRLPILDGGYPNMTLK